MVDPISTGISVGKALLDVLKYVDGKLTNADGVAYRKFLRQLTDYRLLTTEYEAEYAGAVVQSAEQLRMLIRDTTTSLPDTSKLEEAFFALGQAVRRFLSAVDAIEASIRSELDGMVANPAQGIAPDESSQEFLNGWKRAGYPASVLRGNHSLNVMQIQWPGHQMLFLLALGQLRGAVGIILEALCEASRIELPSPLAGLTPGIESLADTRASNA